MKRIILIVALLLYAFALPAYASETSGTILSSQKFGWGDVIGWINFAPTDGTAYTGLVITDSSVTGYAWSRDHGWINFSPSHSGQGVTNTPQGVLGGSAWVSDLGWISMQGVTINQNGEFVGIAGVSGTDTARISFNCSTCSVATDWRPASVRNGNPVTTPGGNDGGGEPSGSSVPAPGTQSTNTIQNSPVKTGVLSDIRSVIQNVLPILTGRGTSQNNTGSAAAGVAVRGNGTRTASAATFLFDVSLRLQENVLSAGKTLIAIVSFTSFGSADTPVVATYTIFNSKGIVVASTTDTFIVQTEQSKIRDFDTTKFTPGSYVLHLQVVYGKGTTNDEEQSFTITGHSGLQCRLSWPF